MKREIKFSLVFRDMWQSAGKYVPTVDQLTRVAPAIIEMGCFAGWKRMAEDLNKSTYYSARILIKRSVNGQNLSMRQAFRRICWTVR